MLLHFFILLYIASLLSLHYKGVAVRGTMMVGHWKNSDSQKPKACSGFEEKILSFGYYSLLSYSLTSIWYSTSTARCPVQRRCAHQRT